MTCGATRTNPPIPSTFTSSRLALDPDLGALRSRLRCADPPQHLRPTCSDLAQRPPCLGTDATRPNSSF
jgi:hypothetical protein